MQLAVNHWVSYHRWNRLDERMARLWVRDLVEFVLAMPPLNAQSVVLDFGCGYFDVGCAVANRVGRVDGFDIEPNTLQTAGNRAAALPNCRTHARKEELPRKTYDLVIANSVFQYLRDDDEVLQTLQLFRSLLRPGGVGKILIGDLIPPGYSAVKDALRSLSFALMNGVLWAMIVYLYKAVFKPGGLQLWKIAPERLAELAAKAGFRCERLNVNVTPSWQRYSCLLTADDS
jgi:SAM-dependent methyltransferase